MADTLCTKCGRKMCGTCDRIEWLGELPYCERCYHQAKIDEEIIAQDENSKARREATGAKW